MQKSFGFAASRFHISFQSNTRQLICFICSLAVELGHSLDFFIPGSNMPWSIKNTEDPSTNFSGVLTVKNKMLQSLTSPITQDTVSFAIFHPSAYALFCKKPILDCQPSYKSRAQSSFASNHDVPPFYPFLFCYKSLIGGLNREIPLFDNIRRTPQNRKQLSLLDDLFVAPRGMNGDVGCLYLLVLHIVAVNPLHPEIFLLTSNVPQLLKHFRLIPLVHIFHI